MSWRCLLESPGARKILRRRGEQVFSCNSRKTLEGSVLTRTTFGQAVSHVLVPKSVVNVNQIHLVTLCIHSETNATGLVIGWMPVVAVETPCDTDVLQLLYSESLFS